MDTHQSFDTSLFSSLGKAMIFAAGLGTRLKPLTDTMPKALIKIANKPLLEHVIEKLKRAGFNEIIINIHHFGQQIIDFVQSKNNFDIHIEFSDERNQLLDTGGGIKNASCFFDDGRPLLIHNVDILSNVDLQQFYNSHITNKASASLLVSHRDTSRYLLFDDANNLCGWLNKQTKEIKSPYPNLNPANYHQLAFSGLHIIDPAIFKYMDKFPIRFSIIDFYLSICHETTIQSYAPNNLRMIDVGKLDALKDAERFVSGK